MARVPSSAIHSRSKRWSADRLPGAFGQLLLGEQARLDPLGQLDLLLGVEQRDLADLLEVVLDRVRGGARHRDLRGGQVIVVIAEDQDLLVLAAAGQGDVHHQRAGCFGGLGLGLGVPGRLVRLRAVQRVDPVGALRLVAHQVLANQVAFGQLGHVGQVGLFQLAPGQRGLQARVVLVVELVELVESSPVSSSIASPCPAAARSRSAEARLASASAYTAESSGPPGSGLAGPPAAGAASSSTALGCWPGVLGRFRAAELAALTTAVTPSFAG